MFSFIRSLARGIRRVAAYIDHDELTVLLELFSLFLREQHLEGFLVVAMRSYLRLIVHLLAKRCSCVGLGLWYAFFLAADER